MIRLLSRHHRRRMQGESGVSLIFALAFLSLLGIFTASILTVANANFKTTEVARSRTDALYGSDGGADFAVQQLRSTATSYCPSSSTALSPAVPTINGATTTVSYTCTGGSSATGVNTMLGSYSIIATGQYGIYEDGAFPTASPWLTENVYGDAYSFNPSNLVAGSGSDGNRLVFNDDLGLPSSTCTFNSTTDPEVLGSCNANQSAPAFTTPTVYIPTAAALATKTSGTCTILYPGVYGTGGLALPTFSATQGYYMASGTYYFNDTGDINLTGWIQGGAKGSSTATLSNGFTSRCPTSYASDANAKTLRSGYNYTGSGVEIVLGGNAVLRFGDTDNTRVELFPRVSPTGSPDAGATDGVSVWGRMYSTTGTTGGTYNLMTQYISYYTVGSGATTADIVDQGLTYLPDCKLWTAPLSNSNAGGASQYMGGAYVNKIYLYSDNNDDTAPIAGSPDIVTNAVRTFTITTVTAQPGGGAATTITVVAQYPTTSGGAPTVLSWRKS